MKISNLISFSKSTMDYWQIVILVCSTCISQSSLMSSGDWFYSLKFYYSLVPILSDQCKVHIGEPCKEIQYYREIVKKRNTVLIILRKRSMFGKANDHPLLYLFSNSKLHILHYLYAMCIYWVTVICKAGLGILGLLE